MYVEGIATENYETDRYLPDVLCPALLLRGDAALGGAIEDADELRAKSLLTRGTVHHVAGVGHVIHPFQPDQYQRLVAEYLEALAS